MSPEVVHQLFWNSITGIFFCSAHLISCIRKNTQTNPKKTIHNRQYVNSLNLIPKC